MYQAAAISNKHSEETRHHSGSCMPNDLRRATPWLYYFFLSWIHFSWVESSQIPDRRTGMDAVLMHAPWILDRTLRSILQYGVLLVEDDSVVQLRHIAGWIIGSINVTPLSD